MERRMLAMLLLLLLPVTVVQVADAACANSCSGHGRCGASNQCTCDSDWALAPDCSLRKCPTGVAWTDKARAANAAHAVAECSNRGVCDYSKGECTCFNGYTGAACQRLRCPSDCSGHGLCYSSATLASQYGPSSLAGGGPTYTNWEKESMTSCMCDMGYTGPDCSQTMCAKNDDPLTTGQAYRTIKIQVGADPTPGIALAGSVRVHFLGEVAVFSAVVVADAAHETACAQAFQSMRTVLTATCSISSVDSVTKGAIYTVAFTEWVHLGGENNLLYHNGNPPLSSFTCDLSQVTSANTPTCVITDGVATNVIEHVYCSNRGLCDFSTGQCVCYADFKGMDCNQPSNIPDSIDDNDGFIINPLGLAYTGTVLHLKTAKGSQADFYFMKIESSTLPILTMDGMGDTKLLHGDLELSTGALTITTIAQTSPAADIADTHITFTSTVLKVRASRLLSTNFKLFEAMVADTNTVVDIRGDGLTTIYTGGLNVVTGGATIANTVNAPSLTVINSFGTFSNSLLKLSTSRATLYPVATDFLLIDASANNVPAFTVEASGRTTIANGGLIVNGLGGGQISNSDTAASALVVSATSTSFASDAVSINTFSGLTHNMLKVTTQVAPAAAVDLFTIDNTGLTTITQGGLYITSGGATVNSGGLRIVNGGETIEFGGLRVKNGGETIELGGLNVINGGGKIATTSATTDVLTVEATATTFSSNARVLRINSKSTIDPTVSMHYLLEATVGASSTSVFKVDATGLTTIVGQGSGGASISDTGTSANTLTLTNSASSFNKKVLGMVATDTNGYSFIDATVGSTSVFNVDASGLTTIVGQGTGGASISDSGTTANTLTLTNSATTFTKTMVSMTSFDTDGSGFTFIDAKAGATPTSVFKVAASGATTIYGGATIKDTGLTIDMGGATITSGGLKVENGGATITAGGLTVTDGGASITKSTDATTLALTNSAGTFTTTMFTLTSSDTDGSGFTFIDAKAGATPTSVFKVAASGATTIAAAVTIQNNGLTITSGGATITAGGLTVTDGGASISDMGTTASTLTLTNSASSFNKAILSMVSTATTGFSVIDAKVGSSSVFNVAPSGLTTISAGGLSVSGGATISGGVTVSNTGLTVSGGVTVSNTGLTVSGGVTVSNTGLTISGGGATIAGGVTVSNTGLTVSGGGASFTGGITAVDTGVSVTTGGARIYDTGTSAETLTVKNSASGITKAILYLDSTETSGFPLIDAKVAGTSQFTVTAAGLTTIASGGLSVKGGVTVVDTGLTVSTGIVGISDTTASTVSTDGALVVSGGVGIGGSIRCAGTSYAVTHTNTSDRRLKTAVKNLEAAQETIRKLRPVTYEWRRDEFPSRNFPTGVFPGFLADEVEEILPDLVQQDGDGWKSMDYTGIVPHLVRAVQEMQDQLEASQAQMTRMQQQIDA